jgi:hypothetical protein
VTRNLIAVIVDAETNGLDDEYAAADYAAALVATGLVNSTGSAQRFVGAFADDHPDLFADAIAAVTS